MPTTPKQGYSMEFVNVPEWVEGLTLPTDCMWQGCFEENVTPFKVRTCDHVMCGPCWQKSAFNIGSEENRCLRCFTPTKLLCFKDYNRFVGHNVYKGELINATQQIRENLDGPLVGPGMRRKANEALDNHEKSIFECLMKQIDWKRNNQELRKAAATKYEWVPIYTRQRSKRKGNRNVKKIRHNVYILIIY